MRLLFSPAMAIAALTAAPVLAATGQADTAAPSGAIGAILLAGIAMVGTARRRGTRHVTA